ncbi:hypothetical protein A3SI_04257 [Nitritalea halalkaliphila LW7]|uniref:Uncharacterized protein n=1 Tax=Nitritalea halalkaliphila LW7 TaxID=1189621 RepID=I5C926_9BACT|nr:hypothetical protein A3SI_04257 [Nitritalea halalkaliphila LW7]
MQNKEPISAPSCPGTERPKEPASEVLPLRCGETRQQAGVLMADAPVAGRLRIEQAVQRRQQLIKVQDNVWLRFFQAAVQDAETT